MVATRRLAALLGSLEDRVGFPEGPSLIALSGGADSACLAYLAVQTGRTRAVHVHHGLPASDWLAEAAQAVARALDLELDVVAVRLPRWSEAAGRDARYQALEAARRPAEWILTAHTRDDQAETVLAHLLRGSGGDGLSGIARAHWPLARPLLDVSRSETREIATLASLPWQDDPANDDLARRRNQIRHRLIPQLEAEFSPRLRPHLAATADTLSRERRPAPVPAQPLPDGVRFPAGLLWAVGREGTARSLREAVHRLRGYGLGRAEEARVWDVLTGHARAAQLAGHLRVGRSGPWLHIRFQPSGEGSLPAPAPGG